MKVVEIEKIESEYRRQAVLDSLERLAVQFDHLKEMIGKIRVFLVEGRREKAFRWLGFIQGVFYSIGIYTIEEMANHNRPTKKDLLGEYPGHSFDIFRCKICPETCIYTKEYMDAPLDEKLSN